MGLCSTASHLRWPSMHTTMIFLPPHGHAATVPLPHCCCAATIPLRRRCHPTATIPLPHSQALPAQPCCYPAATIPLPHSRTVQLQPHCYHIAATPLLYHCHNAATLLLHAQALPPLPHRLSVSRLRHGLDTRVKAEPSSAATQGKGDPPTRPKVLYLLLPLTRLKCGNSDCFVRGVRLSQACNCASKWVTRE